MCISNFIQELGGRSKVGEAVGRTPDAIGMWIWRRKIPRAAWPDLIQAFPEVTVDRLREIEAAALEAA